MGNNTEIRCCSSCKNFINQIDKRSDDFTQMLYRCKKNGGHVCGWVSKFSELKNLYCSDWENNGIDQLELF